MGGAGKGKGGGKRARERARPNKAMSVVFLCCCCCKHYTYLHGETEREAQGGIVSCTEATARGRAKANFCHDCEKPRPKDDRDLPKTKAAKQPESKTGDRALNVCVLLLLCQYQRTRARHRKERRKNTEETHPPRARPAAGFVWRFGGWLRAASCYFCGVRPSFALLWSFSSSLSILMYKI